MKITIDTVSKTIELHQTVGLVELMDFLKTTLKDWESYKVNMKTETVEVIRHVYERNNWHWNTMPLVYNTCSSSTQNLAKLLSATECSTMMLA